MARTEHVGGRDGDPRIDQKQAAGRQHGCLLQAVADPTHQRWLAAEADRDIGTELCCQLGKEVSVRELPQAAQQPQRRGCVRGTATDTRGHGQVFI